MKILINNAIYSLYNSLQMALNPSNTESHLNKISSIMKKLLNPKYIRRNKITLF